MQKCDRSERLNIFERVRVPICRGSSGNFGHRSRSCRVASPLSAIISFGRMPLSALVTSCRIIATGESGQSNWHNCPPREIDRAYRRREGVNGERRDSLTLGSNSNSLQRSYPLAISKWRFALPIRRIQIISTNFDSRFLNTTTIILNETRDFIILNGIIFK